MDIQIKKRSIGKTNKRNGSEAERFYANIFREIGFSHCKTSRLGSKLHDDAGIDLIFLPFNVQVKHGKQAGMNPARELQYMQNRMFELFPQSSPEHLFPKIVIHKKAVGTGKRRTPYDEIVTMTFEDFLKIIQKIEKW